VVVVGPFDFIRTIPAHLNRRILGNYRSAKDGICYMLLIGEDVPDGHVRPSAFTRGTGNAQGFQLLLDPHDAPCLYVSS